MPGLKGKNRNQLNPTTKKLISPFFKPSTFFASLSLWSLAKVSVFVYVIYKTFFPN